jgi:hypothetical protein
MAHKPHGQHNQTHESMMTKEDEVGSLAETLPEAELPPVETAATPAAGVGTVSELPPKPSDTEVESARKVLAAHEAHQPKSEKTGARIMLTNGEARIDYIHKRLDAGATKSEITKELNAGLSLSPVPYQIVFAGFKAWKTKKEAAGQTVPTAADAEMTADAEMPPAEESVE